MKTPHFITVRQYALPGSRVTITIFVGMLLIASSAFAIPILTPHSHNNSGTIDHDTT